MPGSRSPSWSTTRTRTMRSAMCWRWRAIWFPRMRGRVLTVFGCGGDRDRTKRPRMGRAAAEASEIVVVTSDNPRSEEPRAIIDEILPGTAGMPATVEVEPDRSKAIALAMTKARAGDIVVIAGKGHEKTQTIGKQVLPFDDVAVARQALAWLKGKS